MVIGLLCLVALPAPADEVQQRQQQQQQPQPQPQQLVIRPTAFQTLLHPNCSHCAIEAARRAADLRPDDRVLCWIEVDADGYTNDGAVPVRFFLSKYRVLSDGWGVFVYDPEAGYARGFAPGGDEFHFHGWRNGVVVMRGKDGTLYSGLSGIAFDGPKRGSRLRPEPTLTTEWGFWRNRYPASVAYMMYDKYQPVELPTAANADSLGSRVPVDPRLPADTEVLGVWDGQHARAYPIDALAQAGGVMHDDQFDGEPRVVFWYAATRTAAAYHQPWGTSGIRGDAGWVFSLDPTVPAAPFVDQRVKLHWDVTGRADGGGPKLIWMDSVQVKWFAWSAEYPQTSVFGK
jgi:hypothetical protein